MARPHDLTKPSAFFLCCLALAAWSLIAITAPAGLAADEGADEPPSEAPPAGEATPPENKTYPAPPPPPPPPGTDIAQPAPAAPVARTALATKTHSGELVQPFGPIATTKDWNALSAEILRVCKQASKRARAAAVQLGKDWGGELPRDARLGIVMIASLKDDLGPDVPAVLSEATQNGAQQKPLRPSALRGRTVAHVADHESTKAHARALKAIAADKKALREAGYTGMVEIRLQVTVTLTGTPTEAEPAEVGSDPTCLPPDMTSRRKATQAEEDKAEQLYWFARVSCGAQDRTRMINLLREILTLPPNKYTNSARRMLDSRLVRGY